MVTAATPRTLQPRSDDADARIHHQTERNLSFYAEHPELIDQRLAELDREWPAERILGTQLGAAGLVGLSLGLFNRRFLLLPAVALGFLLQTSVQGRSLPQDLWRRLGLRYRQEIDAERQALTAMRSDHRRMHAGEEPRVGSADPTPARKPKGQRAPRSEPPADDGRGGRRAHETP